MVDAVVFDIDGTLIDTVSLHARCWARAFEKFGKHVPADLLRWQIGKGGDRIIPGFLTEEEYERFGKDLGEYRSRLWLRSYAGRATPFRGARELVERVVRDGKKVALATSAKGEELASYIRLLGIESLVDVATSADDVETSKPSPDVFVAALARTGVPAERAIAVGDTPYDAIGAARAGMVSIGMLTGGWSADDLRSAGFLALYVDPEDLLQRYEESPIVRLPLYRDANLTEEVVP